mgnify:CR=1 FL=1
MNPFPPVFNEPQEELVKVDRRVVWIEDGLILLCLGLLWLPILGHRGPVTNGLMVAALGVMVVLLVRRKRRVDALFAAYRKQQEALRGVQGYPNLVGMVPPRQTGEPRRDVSVSRRDDD